MNIHVYHTRFASQLEQIYVNVSIRLLIICKRHLANLWQTFMADHHFCPAPVRTTIAIARLYLKIVRPFGRKWMRGVFDFVIYIHPQYAWDVSYSLGSLLAMCVLTACDLSVDERHDMRDFIIANSIICTFAYISKLCHDMMINSNWFIRYKYITNLIHIYPGICEHVAHFVTLDENSFRVFLLTPVLHWSYLQEFLIWESSKDYPLLRFKELEGHAVKKVGLLLTKSV